MRRFGPLVFALLALTPALASATPPATPAGVIFQVKSGGIDRTAIPLEHVEKIRAGDKVIPYDAMGGRRNPHALVMPTYRVTLTENGARALQVEMANSPNPLRWEPEKQPADGVVGQTEPSATHRTVRVDMQAVVGGKTLRPHEVDEVTGIALYPNESALSATQKELGTILTNHGMLPLVDASPNGLPFVRERYKANK